jgi:hypothetical protein
MRKTHYKYSLEFDVPGDEAAVADDILRAMATIRNFLMVDVGVSLVSAVPVVSATPPKPALAAPTSWKDVFNAKTMQMLGGVSGLWTNVTKVARDAGYAFVADTGGNVYTTCLPLYPAVLVCHVKDLV